MDLFPALMPASCFLSRNGLSLRRKVVASLEILLLLCGFVLGAITNLGLTAIRLKIKDVRRSLDGGVWEDGDLEELHEIFNADIDSVHMWMLRWRRSDTPNVTCCLILSVIVTGFGYQGNRVLGGTAPRSRYGGLRATSLKPVVLSSQVDLMSLP